MFCDHSPFYSQLESIEEECNFSGFTLFSEQNKPKNTVEKYKLQGMSA